jgi:hypothetical protein
VNTVTNPLKKLLKLFLGGFFSPYAFPYANIYIPSNMYINIRRKRSTEKLEMSLSDLAIV